ncbi:hypothetical protein CEXT_169011 [Caerostris extrusa]|uniref:Uncharacterized protein n=1 Tax=Caerostris extrusa TaxID=172846 RepID=A0AAV4SF88_CAEEX|nr:hypothetical protein CEXT_169011 [Caerostris extrusa]
MTSSCKKENALILYLESQLREKKLFHKTHNIRGLKLCLQDMDTCAEENFGLRGRKCRITRRKWLFAILGGYHECGFSLQDPLQDSLHTDRVYKWRELISHLVISVIACVIDLMTL